MVAISKHCTRSCPKFKNVRITHSRKNFNTIIYFHDIYSALGLHGNYTEIHSCGNFRNFPPLENFFVKLTYSIILWMAKKLIWRNFCKNCEGKICSHISRTDAFWQKFRESNVLTKLKKLLKRWFNEIFFRESNFSLYHTVWRESRIVKSHAFVFSTLWLRSKGNRPWL